MFNTLYDVFLYLHRLMTKMAVSPICNYSREACNFESRIFLTPLLQTNYFVNILEIVLYFTLFSF
jgi:hypothetical protein